MVTCPGCGRTNTDDANFCLDCGYDLKSLRQPAASAASAPLSDQVLNQQSAATQIAMPESSIEVSAVETEVATTTATSGAQSLPADSQDASKRTMFMHSRNLAESPTLSCRLIVIEQTGQEGKAYGLTIGENQCGRTQGTVVFPDDPFVSPLHCTFIFDRGQLRIDDHGSLNGVYTRIADERVLKSGDFLRIGGQLFRYEDFSTSTAELSRSEGDDARIWGSPNPGAFGRLLQILEDGKTGQISLLTGEMCNLGREYGDLLFPRDGFISGRHCSFIRNGQTTRLRDLGSSNGTYVRIQQSAVVTSGDFLLIGNQMLRVEIRG